MHFFVITKRRFGEVVRRLAEFNFLQSDKSSLKGLELELEGVADL